MSTMKRDNLKLPATFEGLQKCLAPRAITSESHYNNTIKIVDRLMSVPKLTKGQAEYLETLVQLVEHYEAANHAIDVKDLSGIDALRHLADENNLNASDIARLLHVHASMGSKLLSGERALTIDHIKALASRFKVRPEVFIS